jgi:hypothetical protein
MVIETGIRGVSLRVPYPAIQVRRREMSVFKKTLQSAPFGANPTLCANGRHTGNSIFFR